MTTKTRDQIEHRIGQTGKPMEVRSNEDGTVTIAGYAAVFDSIENGEVIRSSAFTRSLAHGADVKLKINHAGLPLARTKSGTLGLEIDDVGLRMEATLDPANPAVAELVSGLARGDVDQMSFAFRAVDAPVVSGVRELREVKLTDVSVVTDPWYQATSVSLVTRSAFNSFAAGLPLTDEERAALMEAARMAASTSFDSIRQAVREAIAARIEALSGARVWVWIADIGVDWVIYGLDGDRTFRCMYTADDAGVVTIGDPIEVERVVSWVDMQEPAASVIGRSMRNLEIARALVA